MHSRNVHWSHVVPDRKVYVIPTSEEGTRLAFETAEQLAARQAAGLVVLIPHIVPYPAELERCGHDLTQLAEPYRARALDGRVETTIRVCACREARHIFRVMLVDQAHVVMGGHRGRWRRTREERLARVLEDEGHHVVFVDVDAAPGRAPSRLSNPTSQSQRDQSSVPRRITSPTEK